MTDPIGPIESDNQVCLRCGSWYLDTGWECNDCGYDNYEAYAPKQQRE